MILGELINYYYPLVISVIGCALVGLIAGCMGSFALLKKQSLLGDTISHAALPGTVLALLCINEKNPAILLLGGALTGALGTFLTMFILQKTKLALDTILGVILSSFFGIGLLLISWLQKFDFANQTVINKFLFGNVALILVDEIQLIALMSICIITIAMLFWKETTISIFDPEYYYSLGYRPWVIETVTNTLLILTIVTGLQTVGVILMSSLIIAPAAAARQWTSRNVSLFIASGAIGTIAATIGGVASILFELPSGPMIIITLSSIVLFSLWFAPKRMVAHRG